ncbi:hypothetical protein ACIQX3_24570 [Peribacillus frigoritolerans]|uniref:hypothetical protein n=1 Tax=Peribacillus frigoritolerans TaxID=450367 RepID=UPI0038301F37
MHKIGDFFYVLFRVLAPPTPDTMTATHAIQPIIIIKESAYIVKNFIWKHKQKPLGMIKGLQADGMKGIKLTNLQIYYFNNIQKRKCCISQKWLSAV